MRLTGRIRQWQDARGFGFIQPADGGEDVFVHISEIRDGARPVGGETVTYELRRNGKGRRQATRVQLSSGSTARHPPRTSTSLGHRPWLVTGAFLALVSLLAAGKALPVYVPLSYLVLSLITYLAYDWDKSSARRKVRRTPEKTLLLLGLIGGWPGGLLAQRTLRHKSSKQSFQVQFWITVLLNCAALAWLLLNPDQWP